MGDSPGNRDVSESGGLCVVSMNFVQGVRLSQSKPATVTNAIARHSMATDRIYRLRVLVVSIRSAPIATNAITVRAISCIRCLSTPGFGAILSIDKYKTMAV